MRFLYACSLLALFPFVTRAQDITAKVRGPLVPVLTDRGTVLAYEVELANSSSEDVSLTRFEVSANPDGKPLLTQAANELAQNLKQIRPPISKDVRTIKLGAAAVVFCWLEFHEAPPRELHHQIFYRPAKGTEQTLRIPPVPVAPAFSLRLSPPLPAGDWWAANALSNTSDHRRAQIRIDGNAASPFAQRYAIDWVEICEGRLCGYGKDVLAVQDAQVVAVKDGIPDNQPGAGSRAVKITVETVMGNHVVLDLGNHLFAVYAHLQPGSLKVKVGDHVRRGQTLGLLGNSGNSDAAHLHFQVAQATSVEAVTSMQSDPFPYLIDRYEVVGSYSGKGTAKPGKPEPRTAQLPLENQLIRFAN